VRPGASVAALAALAALAACARPPAVKTVVIDKMAYGAAPAGLHVGDSLTWRNQDILRHTATAKDGSFDVDLQPGASASVKLKSAGAVQVYCRYHPDMTMRLTVEP
jgi:plastocyanin